MFWWGKHMKNAAAFSQTAISPSTLGQWGETHPKIPVDLPHEHLVSFNPSTQEAEAGRFLSSRPAWSTKLVPGQPGLYKETLSPKNKTKQNKTKQNKTKQNKKRALPWWQRETAFPGLFRKDAVSTVCCASRRITFCSRIIDNPESPYGTFTICTTQFCVLHNQVS